MLVINDGQFIERAEIIREKGTNRSKFFRGEIDKYSWVDIGSSFLPSDIIAAFLYAQLEKLNDIQKRRQKVWAYYFKGLEGLAAEGKIILPVIPDYATNNAHMFFIQTKSLGERTALLDIFKKNDILAVFHYISLHKSTFYESRYGESELPNADRFTDTLVRLPFYFELTQTEQDKVIDTLHHFYKSK
jgi:dTDP-4-amino-4,6-dideoxygalactose transaminase